MEAAQGSGRNVGGSKDTVRFFGTANLDRQLHAAPARCGCTNKGCRCEESKNVHGGESESLFSFPPACVCIFLKYSGANRGSGLSIAVGGL